MVLLTELLETYGFLTQARSTILMGKHLGMTYDCSDDVSQFQIAAQIMERRAS